MAFNFRNPSRSEDASRHWTCFWGHDNARATSFLVDGAVLSSPNQGLRRTPEEHHARH